MLKQVTAYVSSERFVQVSGFLIKHSKVAYHLPNNNKLLKGQLEWLRSKSIENGIRNEIN